MIASSNNYMDANECENLISPRVNDINHRKVLTWRKGNIGDTV